MKNYRLNNDIILTSNYNKSIESLRYFRSKSNDLDIQYLLNDMYNIRDFKVNESDIEVADFYTNNVTLYFRQNISFKSGFNAFRFTFINELNGIKELIKFDIMFNNIKAINPKTIDGSVFFGCIDFTIPFNILHNDTATLYYVEQVDANIEKYDDYISKELVTLVNFEPLSKLDLNIGNVENYAKRIDDYLEIGLVNLDPYKTLERSILDQLGMKNQYINVTHNIKYGYSSDINEDFENITWFKEIAISNTSNSLYPIEYRPIFDNKYDRNSINQIMFLMVESVIDCGGIKFNRYTEIKLDFRDLITVNDNITINPVTVKNEIINNQTIIETKREIKRVVINQNMGYNMADNNHNIAYINGASLVIPELNQSITSSNNNREYYMIIFNKKGDILLHLFSKIDGNGMLYFYPDEEAQSVLNNEFKSNEKVTQLPYNIHKIDGGGYVHMNGFITKR